MTYDIGNPGLDLGQAQIYMSMLNRVIHIKVACIFVSAIVVYSGYRCFSHIQLYILAIDVLAIYSCIFWLLMFQPQLYILAIVLRVSAIVVYSGYRSESFSHAGFDINFLTNLSIRASAILILLARNCKLRGFKVGRYPVLLPA